MSKAMYAFSGDPPTFGHLNIIERVARTFDEIIVGIGVNPDKKYMFSLDSRKKMTAKMVEHLSNVKVISFKGLLINYAYQNGIQSVVRGIRNTTDLEYEQTIHAVGASQRLDIETYCLFADSKLAHVSSSSVKALQKESGFIHDYVPLHVKQALEIEMSNRYMLGVTGTVGAGKSTACKKIKKWCDVYKVPCTYIDLDKIGHDILNKLKEPAYVDLRRNLMYYFPKHVLQKDGFVNRKVLGQLVFEKPDLLVLLNELMKKPILVRLVEALREATGLVILESALFVEAGILNICNNNILLVTVEPDEQRERLKERDYGKEQIERRINSQYSQEEKLKKIKEEIRHCNHGSVFNASTQMDKILRNVGYPLTGITPVSWGFDGDLFKS